jgi:hypothetical protein
MPAAFRPLRVGWASPSRSSAGGSRGLKRNLACSCSHEPRAARRSPKRGHVPRPCRRVCAEIDAAREADPAGRRSARPLRIAAPLTFGPTHFAPVLADMARRHPQLHIHTSYSDRFVDLIAEGFDCAIRVGYLQDSNLIARHVGPIYGKLVASPDYIEAHGSPETPDALVRTGADAGHRSLAIHGRRQVVTVHPQGRFKADNGTALPPPLWRDWASPGSPMGSPMTTSGLRRAGPVMTRYPPPPGRHLCHPPAGAASRRGRCGFSPKC